MAAQKVWGQKGQSQIEYSFLVAFISIAVIVVLTFLGSRMAASFEALNALLPAG